jgi:hypothetical protein
MTSNISFDVAFQLMYARPFEVTQQFLAIVCILIWEVSTDLSSNSPVVSLTVLRMMIRPSTAFSISITT